MPDQFRNIQMRAATIDSESRSVLATLATEAVVVVLDQKSWKPVDEILLLSGAELPSQVPLLTDHTRSVDGVIGSVRGIRRNGEVTGKLYFAADPGAEQLWEKVQAGHVTDLSVGYVVDEETRIEPGRSGVVAGRTYTAETRPLHVVSRWTLKEVSLVAIGADPQAKTRSSFEERSMSATVISSPEETLRQVIASAVQRGGASLRWADAGKIGLRHLDQQIPPNDRDVCRAMASNATIGSTIYALFNAALLAGFAAEPDTTTAWTLEMAARNFVLSELYTQATGGRLTQLARGDVAEEEDLSAIGLARSTYHLRRYAQQIVVDETDMADGQPLGAILSAVRQLGAEARRIRPDLVYSLILANPNLPTGIGATMQYDNVQLFHAAHDNLNSGALGGNTLAAGAAAIGNQLMVDPDGLPVHPNNQPGVLIVPPDLHHAARQIVRHITLGDGQDLRVLSESRLGAAGLLDPESEGMTVGSATNWLLASRSAALPAIVVVGLDGSLEPVSRQFSLGQGRWGVAFDIKLDVAAVAVDHRAVYFSSGTA